MKKYMFLILFLIGIRLCAQEAPTSKATGSMTPATKSLRPTPAPAIKKWDIKTVPWGAWFKKNAIVTDKTDYVHILWDAQDFKVNFEMRDKKAR